MLKFLFCFISTNLFAEYAYFGNHSVDLGYSSNANFEMDQFEQDDFFWSMDTENGITNSTFYPSLQVGYLDYLKQDTNDLFDMSLKLKIYHEISPKFRPSYWFDVFNRKYIHQDSGKTDDSFSHRGFKIGTKNANDIGEKSSLAYGLEFSHRNFTNFYDRKDNTLMVFTDFLHNFNDTTSLITGVKIHTTKSSLNYYENNGFDLKVDGEHYFTDDLNMFGGASLSKSVYDQRKFIRTLISKSKKENILLEKESNSLWKLNLGLDYNLRKNYFLKPEFILVMNNSNNRFNEYDDLSFIQQFGAFF